MKTIQLIAVIVLLLFSSTSLYAGDEPARHRGWHLGGAGVVHVFNLDQNDDDNESPPDGIGGGVNAWAGYRGRGRWEIRLNVNAAGVPRTDQRDPTTDFLLGLSLEPIVHFRKNPPRWDPYISFLELGFNHLFVEPASGPSLSLIGTGLQVHLNERFSIYAAAKLRFRLFSGDAGGIGAGVEFPIGVSYRF